MSPWKWKLCCQQADFHGFQERTERWAGFPIWLFHQLWLVLETFTTSLSERFLHSLVTPARLSSRILPQVHLLKPQKVISKLIYFRLHSTSNLTTWFFWTFIIHAVVLANICVTVGWATFLLGCLLSTFSPPFTVCFQEAFLYTKSRVKFQSRFLFWHLLTSYLPTFGSGIMCFYDTWHVVLEEFPGASQAGSPALWTFHCECYRWLHYIVLLYHARDIFNYFPHIFTYLAIGTPSTFSDAIAKLHCQWHLLL